MRSFFLLPLILWNILLSADSINVAPYTKPHVRFLGPLPIIQGNNPKPKVTAMDPQNLIDGNYFSYIEFPPHNIGSGCIIELYDSTNLSSIRCFALGNFSASYSIRIKGFRLSVSRDSMEWTVIADRENPDSSSFIVPISSESKWKFIKIEITKEDPIRPSVLAEISVYTPIDSGVKVISSIAMSDSQLGNGDRIKNVQWQTKNMVADDHVDIFYKKNGDAEYTTLALNEWNDGTYAWNTSLLSTGEYFLKISPATGDRVYSLTKPVKIENITDITIDLNNQDYNEIINSSDRNDHFSAAYFNDSIKLHWNFVTTLKKNFQYRLSFSLDSGATWTPLTIVNDTSVHTTTFAVPPFEGFGVYSFFRLEILIDNTVIASKVSSIPYTIIGKFSDMPFNWHKPSLFPTAWQGGAFGSYRSVGVSMETIVLGPQWKVTNTGANVPSWNTQAYSDIAIGDIDGEGTAEVIGMIGPRNENGNYLFVDTLNSFSTLYPLIADYNNDGVNDILYSKPGGFNLVQSSGTHRASYSFPSEVASFNQPVCADLNSDGSAEFIYATRLGKTMYVFRPDNSFVDGFPVFIDSIMTNPVVADLNKSGVKNIIVCNDQAVFCYDHKGMMLPGFPLTLFSSRRSQGIDQLSVADVDGDQYLDIIVTARNQADKEIATVYCINRLGQLIPGWPIVIRDYMVFFGMRTIYDPLYGTVKNITPFEVYGNFSAPYILSMDGDSKNEVILFNTNGFLYVLNGNGTHKQGFPRFLGIGSSSIKPHFGDFDNNGSLDMLFPIFKHSQYYVGNYSFGPGTYNPARLPWPTYMQNVRRNPIAPDPMITTIDGVDSSIPDNYELFQNYPNPFNPSTTIMFSIPKTGRTTLSLCDLLGREIAVLVDEVLTPARYTKTFSFPTLSSGLYFYILRSGSSTMCKKMIILK